MLSCVTPISKGFLSRMLPAWFVEGRLNLTGQLVLPTGALGTLGMLEIRLRKKKDQTGEWILIFISLITLAHVAMMGAKKWIDPGGWPGSTPNMSLIGGIAAAIAAYYFFRAWRRDRHRDTILDDLDNPMR